MRQRGTLAALPLIASCKLHGIEPFLALEIGSSSHWPDVEMAGVNAENAAYEPVSVCRVASVPRPSGSQS